jgi:hypothetical protein
MPSLIMSNVFTKMGRQTFTLRWGDEEIMNWSKIYDFLYKKSGMLPKYHKIKIDRNYINHEKILNIEKFDLNDFAYYDLKGNATQTGLLKIRINEVAIRNIRDSSGCIHLW